MKFHSIVRKDVLILGMAALERVCMMLAGILYENGLMKKTDI